MQVTAANQQRADTQGEMQALSATLVASERRAEELEQQVGELEVRLREEEARAAKAAHELASLRAAQKNQPPRQCGVGMLLQKDTLHHGGQVRGGHLVVTKLVPGLPAAQSGKIEIGDVLFEVDQTDVAGMELADVFSLIKGPENSAIDLEFRRGEEPIHVRLIREFATLPTVPVEAPTTPTAALRPVSLKAQARAVMAANALPALAKDSLSPSSPSLARRSGGAHVVSGSAGGAGEREACGSGGGERERSPGTDQEEASIVSPRSMRAAQRSV